MERDWRRYNYQQLSADLERDWQSYWAEVDIYRTPNPGDPEFDPTRPKYVVLDFFPYPSGTGLHIGHPLGYIATDIKSRFMRMRGFNVLHAMGFDAFGLPAEQFAIQTGQHPRITTEQNIASILAQLNRLGFDHDPHRRFSTTDPEYYRWTQWIFLQLYDSFYDPTLRWRDAAGREMVGRARPIGELAEVLRAGLWVLSAQGIPVPADHSEAEPVRQLSEEELDAALGRARLAYVEEVPVNWCPQLGTVLSNEEVTREGLSERGNFPVYRRPLKQWVLRITAYADRLLEDLELVDWPAGIVEMQRNWIGPSQGAKIRFSVAPDCSGAGADITVFTTRPDTVFGATYMVLAPAHPLVDVVTTDEYRAAVTAYRAEAQVRLAKRQDGDAAAEKTGVFTGAFAVNPASGARIPIWIADYVLMEYGSGAIMGVPGHDQRDLDFARAQGLAVIPVVIPDDDWLRASGGAAEGIESLRAAYLADPASFEAAFIADGTAINSRNAEVSLDGLPTAEAKARIIEWLTGRDLGVGERAYKLRDWLFSRQRYWGEPFPIVYDAETGRPYPLDLAELPVLLPEIEDFRPEPSSNPEAEPRPPLIRASEWREVHGIVMPDGHIRLVAQASGSATVEGHTGSVRRFLRELNTMPNWAGSCWYYLRYFDPRNDKAFVSHEAERYWSIGLSGEAPAGTVDLYVGGAEHAVLHLLYARFWHKVLYDLGHVSTPEPFQKLFNQGMITADAYTDSRGVYVDIHDVELRTLDGQQVPFNTVTGERLNVDPGKMGKRYKNGIPPEEVCDEYSVDAFRMYEMYLGPLETSKPWQPGAIVGMMRFANAVWRTATRVRTNGENAEPSAEIDRLVHKTIRKVTEDVDRLRMNTALAALIELNNELVREREVHPQHGRALVLMLAPFAPHLAEELFSRLFPDEHRELGSVVFAPWPGYDPAKVVEETVEVAITVNGRKRATIEVSVDIQSAELERQALEHPSVQRALCGKAPRRVVVVQPDKPKLVNIVLP